MMMEMGMGMEMAMVNFDGGCLLGADALNRCIEGFFHKRCHHLSVENLSILDTGN